MQKTKEELSKKLPHELLNEEKPFLERNLLVRGLLLKELKLMKDELNNYKEKIFLENPATNLNNSFDFHTAEDDAIRLLAKTFADLKSNLNQMEQVIAQQQCNILCWKAQQEVDTSENLRNKLSLKA